MSWKTGTSSGFKDAWTLGVFGQYALGVWAGNFSGESNRHLVGRELVAPFFFDLIDTVRVRGGISDESVFAWMPPTKVRKISICSVSGMLPTPICKHQRLVSFIPGVSPIKKCDVHREVWVSTRDGKLSCSGDRSERKKLIFEFWPSDLMELFRLAGIPRKPPPARAQSCGLDEALQEGEAVGMAPEILSPLDVSTYSLRSQSAAAQLIPLKANIDASAREILWFVNNQYIGKTKSGDSYLWKAPSGIHQIRAVDDLGRSTERQVRVQFVD